MIPRYRSSILAAWLVLLVVLGGILATRFELRTDLSVFLPYARTPAQELLIDQLRAGSSATQLVLAALEGDDPDTLARASAALANRLRANPAIASVVNAPESVSEREREFLFDNRYLLLANDRGIMGWEIPQLRRALKTALDRLVSSLGAIDRDFVRRDPAGEWRRLIEREVSRTNASLHNGAWLSSSGKRAPLLITTRAPAFDLDAQQQLLDTIRRDYEAVASASMRLVLTGPGVFAVSARDTISTDAWRLSLLGNVAVVALLLCIFRSLRPVLLTLLPLLTGLLAGTAAVTLAYGFVHGITLAFGVTLTGIAIDYPLHVLVHRRLPEQAERTVERIWPTLRLGILTTTLAYAVLLLADIQGLAQLGLLSAVAVGAAGLVTRWVLPLLVGPVAAPAVPVPSGCFAAPSLLPAARLFVSVSVLASALYLFWSAADFWQNDLAALSPVPSQAKEADRALRADLGAADLRHVVLVVGDSAQEVLERCEAVVDVLESVRRERVLEGYDAPCAWLPSVSAQRRRQAQIPEADTLRARLHEASRGLPFRAGAFEPFVTDLGTARARDPIVPEDLQGTVFGARLEALLFSKPSRWIGVIPLRQVADSTVLARSIAADGVRLFYLDLKRESEEMVAGFRQRALKLWGFGLFGILVVLSFGLRSLPAALRLLLPVGGAVVLVCAILLLAGQRISLFHLVALLLVMGLGLDYLLFFRRAPSDAEERRRSAQAVALCAGTTVLVFGILALSQIPVLFAIGSTVALGSIICFALAGVFAPPSSTPIAGKRAGT